MKSEHRKTLDYNRSIADTAVYHVDEIDFKIPLNPRKAGRRLGRVHVTWSHTDTQTMPPPIDVLSHVAMWVVILTSVVTVLAKGLL